MIEQSSGQQANTQKQLLIGALILVALLLLAGGVFAIVKNQNSGSSTNGTTPTISQVITNSPTQTISSTLTPTSVYQGWQSYTDSKNNFSFKYASNWTLKDNTPNYAAEGFTASQIANCHASNLLLSTPEGYSLSIDYNLDGCPQGAANYVFAASNPITIAGASYVKTYINNCDDPTKQATCASHFSTIVVTGKTNIFNQGTPKGNAQVGRYFTLNGKTSDIVFNLDPAKNSNYLSLNDTSFAPTEAKLDMLLKSIQFN